MQPLPPLLMWDVLHLEHVFSGATFAGGLGDYLKEWTLMLGTLPTSGVSFNLFHRPSVEGRESKGDG